MILLHISCLLPLTHVAADFLKKRVLLVDLQMLEGSRSSRATKVYSGAPNEDGDIKAVFQEAELSDAVLFFDECEVIFAKREIGGNKILNLLLCELERYNGIVFLATNKPLDLDEAMHRRITSVYEFKAPDHCQRRMIWQSYASSSVPLHPDIPWDSIALKYELTGGFIKNAVLSALLRAVSRSSERPVILEEDIVHGCSLQMRGSLRLRANSDSIVPTHGLDRLVLSDSVRKTMESVVSFEKARSVLFGQWRFDETMQYAQGTVMLVTGPHGCGKRAVCEGLAFELGRPMRVIDVSELMLNMSAGVCVVVQCIYVSLQRQLNAFTGEQLKISLQSVFSDARLTDSLLVIENVQDLPVSADEPTIIVACLASFLRSFPGVCILCGACATDSSHRLHPLLKRLLRFTLHLPAMGQKQVRKRMSI